MNDAATAAGPTGGREDIAAIAKGGRTNLLGFPLRLSGRIPFLLIAGRFYGADALGRLASALVVIEFLALLSSMGLKRGLARRLTEAGRKRFVEYVQELEQVVADAMAAAAGRAAPARLPLSKGLSPA